MPARDDPAPVARTSDWRRPRTGDRLLHVVAINYHGAADAARLLRSLQAQSNASWALTVVDNSQSEDEFERLRTLMTVEPRMDVVQAPRNLGYYGAAEWWRRAHRLDADWVAVSNTDVECADRDLCTTLAALPSGPAVLAPDVTALPRGRRQNPYMRTRPSGRAMLVRRVLLGHGASANLVAGWSARRRRPTHVAEAGPIYAPHGSFVLFSRSWFAAGGSWHHPTFLFGEEVTIAERARRLGLEVSYEPSLRLVHREHQSTGTRRSGRLLAAQRDAVRLGHRLITGRAHDEDGLEQRCIPEA